VRPSVCVVSQISGLRAAFEARGLVGPWLQYVNADSPALAKCDVLVGEPAACGPLVDKMPNLVWLQSTFAGCNQLLTASERRDYTATRLAGCFGPDMAEFAMLHILARERRYEAQREQQKRREWVHARNPSTGARQSGGDYRRLSALTLGILGLGDIGSDIARSCSLGLRMRVVGCRRDTRHRKSDALAGVERVYGLEELSDFLANSDYIASVLPSTPQTRGLLNRQALAACAERAPTLINVGRGDLASEEDLIEALDKGWLSHYVGDVFSTEPLPADSPLWTHEKVTVTPHNAAVTAPEDVAIAFEENLARYEAEGAAGLKNVFRWEAGY
jgi:phosphoglycerate dehydrogenase-like enzyme